MVIGDYGCRGPPGRQILGQEQRASLELQYIIVHSRQNIKHDRRSHHGRPEPVHHQVDQTVNQIIESQIDEHSGKGNRHKVARGSLKDHISQHRHQGS